MKILCCFKIVADLDKVIERDWEAPMVPGPDFSYVRKIISCYDEACLETALRIRDSAKSLGEEAELTAVTLGDGRGGDFFFRSLFALGFERIIHVKTEENLTFRPKKAVAMILEAVKGKKYDVILCGSQAADSQSGVSPWLLSRELKLPCVSNVTDAALTQEGLKIRRKTEDGEMTAFVKVPAVYTVGESLHPYLRMASMKNIMDAGKRRPEIIELNENAGAENVFLESFAPKEASKECLFIEGDSMEEKAENLIKLCPEVKKP